jgi:hypothetical protein
VEPVRVQAKEVRVVRADQETQLLCGDLCRCVISRVVSSVSRELQEILRPDAETIHSKGSDQVARMDKHLFNP